MGNVAIIDIGSNSIKALVATRAPDGEVRALATPTLDVRISAGISRAAPRLTAASMDRALAAIQQLLADVARFAPTAIILVATSAVRDALNGDEFCQRVRVETGHELRILTGDEEARLIGRGLLCDPAMSGLTDFYAFDLGGGSLECLAFRGHRVQQAVSLPLGCVRLTERFIADATTVLPPGEIAALRAHVRAAVLPPAFGWGLSATSAAIATGGTMTTARAVWAARAGQDFAATDPVIPVEKLEALAQELAGLTLAQRQGIRGLPAARADVFPTALLTLAELAAAGGVSAFRHSFYNLRFGLAADALGAT